MADLTKPIDITAVNKTAAHWDGKLRTLNNLSASEVLKYFTLLPNIQDTKVLTFVVKNKKGSRKYTGKFTGSESLGKIEPNELKVRPIVYEMSDEPERYRESYIADVAGGLDAKKHPFEKWLIDYGIAAASEELHDSLYSAKYDSDPNKTEIEDSFDGIGTILDEAIKSGKIAVDKGNYKEYPDAYTVHNIRDRLLEQYRALPQKLKQKGVQMMFTENMGEMYDDWYESEHDRTPSLDQHGQTVLEGSNGKCTFIRLSCMPGDCQDVITTIQSNRFYGTDKIKDMKSLKAFNSGNPYSFDATMKYVFGLSFGTYNKLRFYYSRVKTS